MLDGDFAAGSTVWAPHTPQAGVAPATDEGLLGTGNTKAQQWIRSTDELLIGEGIACL